jgi:hypothetical protein
VISVAANLLHSEFDGLGEAPENIKNLKGERKFFDVSKIANALVDFDKNISTRELTKVLLREALE